MDYESIEGTHLVLIYGVDTIQNTLFCKDFSGSKFVNFNVSFRVLRKSLELYHRSFARESDGLLAFQIKKVYPDVDYARVYSEFHKLRQEYFSYGAAYGVGSINLIRNDIKNQLLSMYQLIDGLMLSIIFLNYLNCSIMGIRYLSLKRINVSENILKDMVALLSICRDDFKIAAEFFCDSIQKFKYDCCDIKNM